MKKINKLLILALLFMVTLNFNYLGMMDKSIIVESSEYKEGNTSNLVLNKILSDNELKQEIPKMFNYASNGNYIDSNWGEQNNPEYITNGLYSSIDEDGTSYYFRGDVNNNLQFGTYDEDYYVYANGDAYYQSEESCKEAGNSICTRTKLASKDDKMYWKIVRVNGDGSLRVIYNGPGVNALYPDIVSFSNEEISGVVGGVAYNLKEDDPKYSGYTYDNGTDSFVKKEVDTWYKNTLGSNRNYDSKVIEGRFCSDSSGYNYDGTGYFASYDRLGQVDFNFDKDNSPTFICPSTNESYGGSYRLKAGLITGDEMALAGESSSVSGNSYLNPGANGTKYWTMTPSYFSYGNAGVMSAANNGFYGRGVISARGIRPVINLSTENMTLIGDGTKDNPYQLEEVRSSNSYKGAITIEIDSSIDIENAFDNITIPNGVTWTSQDDSIARIENGKILGLKDGTTTITGVSSDGLTTYEIKVTVIKNPITMSSIYIVIGMLLILILGTTIVLYYKKKFRDL